MSETPLAVKSLVSVLRLVMKSLILEGKVCSVFCVEHRKKEPVAVGRLHGHTRCQGTPSISGFSGKATHW